MIKPLPPQTPDQTVTRGGRGEEQLMFVVEVGKVKLALPPRLSKVVQLFKEVVMICIMISVVIRELIT